MKLGKTLLLSLPAAAMALGAFALASSSRKSNVLSVDAAEYTTSNRSVTLDNEGNIHATFSVTDNNLTMRGWLLCLFSSKPSFDAQSRKLTNSDKLHPTYADGCAHYFFAANTTGEGSITVTWAYNAVDQKEAWSATEAEPEGEEEHTTLTDCLDDQDWYLVIGPRHYNDDWVIEDNEHPIGAGQGGYWENCDYYVGQKSIVFADLPSGEIFLDLSQFTGWKGDEAKFGFYFWDNNEHSAYSEFATPVSGLTDIYVASYEVDFTPTKMLALRMNSTAEALSTDKDAGKWNQTGDLDFHEHAVVGITGWDAGWANALATVDGLGNTVVLDHYKRNGSGESEHYNESVALKEDDEFTIGFGGSSYHAYTTHASLTDAFVIHEDKIHVNTAGSYAFYFNTTESKRSVYITTPALAAADEWAQSFLGANCTATMDNWGVSASSYNDLSAGAKALFMAVDYIADPNTVVEGYVAQAVLRYDYVLTLYGTGKYDDFMGRIKAKGVPESASLITPMSQDNGNLTLIVALVSVGACALALGGSVLLHKRKNHI